MANVNGKLMEDLLHPRSVERGKQVTPPRSMKTTKFDTLTLFRCLLGPVSFSFLPFFLGPRTSGTVIYWPAESGFSLCCAVAPIRRVFLLLRRRLISPSARVNHAIHRQKCLPKARRRRRSRYARGSGYRAFQLRGAVLK